VSRGDSYAHGDHDAPTLKLAGWPTPTASEGVANRDTFHHGPNNGAAGLAAWATPLANTAAGGGSERHLDGKRSNLRDQVFLAHWPATAPVGTPTAVTGGTPEQFLARKAKAKAKGASLGESLTSLSLQAQLADSGTPPTGSSAATPLAERPSPGQLNPDHSRWLQGYPTGWGSCRGTATLSSRKSGRRSSKRR
jgi:hypothetical protein